MRDPEDLARARREQRRGDAEAPAADQATDQGPDNTVAMQRLAAERAADPAARGRAWLARWRSDRHDLQLIASDEGLDLEAIRAGIDAALRAEGSSLAAAEAARGRPPVRLGRGGAPQQQLQGIAT